MLMTGLSLFTACKDDETNVELFDRPEITVPTTGLAVQVGQTATFTVPVTSDGKIASVTVNASTGSASVTNAGELAGKTSGSANISYEAPQSAGSAIITVTVTDQQPTAKSESKTFAVNVTEEPQADVVEVFASTSGVVEDPEGTAKVTDYPEGTITWTKDKIYVLRGFVFVNPNETLVIEKGTIIKGQPGSGAGASALIVARGGKIMAEGTAEEPIIFTALEDQIVPGEMKSTLPLTSRGLWGGVILLGNAPITTATGIANIEGIPVEEIRGQYGGEDEADNSGVMKYVSIRHGGTEIGEGNEINGLTMGGVGNGTTIEFIEVISNKDDGFEWFGGTVNTKYLVSAYCGDEGMDYDQGWKGTNQFWFVYQDEEGDKGGEHDGGSSDCETCEPYSTPVIANATYRGGGANTLLVYQDNAGGTYVNSIFTNYGKGIQIEDLESGEDSYNRFVTGDLMIRNNIFHNVVGGDENKYILSTGATANNLSAEAGFANNITLNPEFNNLFIPAADVSAVGTLEGDFFNEVNFIGAFDPAAETPWHAGWTEWSQHENIQ